MIFEGREAGNDSALDAEGGDLYEMDCSASGTISRIVPRSASSVLRLGSSMPRRYSSTSSTDILTSLESWLQAPATKTELLRAGTRLVSDDRVRAESDAAARPRRSVARRSCFRSLRSRLRRSVAGGRGRFGARSWRRTHPAPGRIAGPCRCRRRSRSGRRCGRVHGRAPPACGRELGEARRDQSALSGMTFMSRNCRT